MVDEISICSAQGLVYSLVPRPLPVLTQKSWEWPADEAVVLNNFKSTSVCSFFFATFDSLTSFINSPSEVCMYT